MSFVFLDHGITVGKIYTAQATFVIDHSLGQLTITLRYAQGTSKVVACSDSISPDLERGHPFQRFLEVNDFHLLLKHAEKILSDQGEEALLVSTLEL